MSRILDGIIPRLTVVDTCPCRNCGKPVKVKIMKSGTAYYSCAWSDDEGDPCNDHHRWGGKKSIAMQRAYLFPAKDNENDPEKDNTIDPNPEPGPAPNGPDRKPWPFV